MKKNNNFKTLIIVFSIFAGLGGLMYLAYLDTIPGFIPTPAITLPEISVPMVSSATGDSTTVHVEFHLEFSDSTTASTDQIATSVESILRDLDLDNIRRTTGSIEYLQHEVRTALSNSLDVDVENVFVMNLSH